MKPASIIVILLTWTIAAFGQGTNWSGGYSFYSTFGKAGQQNISFNFPELDTVPYRLDSVFKYDTAKYGYFFMSFDRNGELIGQGSFRFGLNGEYEKYSVEHFDYLLKWSAWSDLHLWEFADTADMEKGIVRLLPCFGKALNVTIEYGEWVHEDAYIQSRLSQIVWRRDD